MVDGMTKTQSEFIAKTEKGRLKFYNKRQSVGGKDPEQTEKEKNISDPNIVDPRLRQQGQAQPAQQAQPQQPQQPEGPPDVPKTKGTLTLAFGRFNPPTIGHEQLMNVARDAAKKDKDGQYMIFPSRTQDKKNPLDPDQDPICKECIPIMWITLVRSKTKTILDVLKMAHNDGYTNVRIIGGADRVKEFEKLSGNCNGKLYAFDNIEVVSSGDRDPDAKGMEGMSASRMRLAAAKDFKT